MMTRILSFATSDIAPVDTSSLVDKVELAIIDYLIEKNLKPGDMIPKEMELSKSLGVSRTVVRESLNRLKTLGLIESVKHKGTVIRSPDLLTFLKKSMIPGILTRGTLLDIFEFRLALEIGMADLVFMRKKPGDIDELYDIVSKEPVSTNSVLFDADHEIKFHGKLYEISGNTTVMEFQTLLLPMFRYIYENKIIPRPEKRIRHVSHRQLVDTLRDQTPEAFRNAMRLHLDNHFQRIASDDYDKRTSEK